MVRSKRRRPLLASADFTSGQNDTEDEAAKDIHNGDDVEDFLTNRHTEMARRHGVEASDSSDGDRNEPETMEYNVLNIDTSDSEDDEDAEDSEDKEKGDWDGNRRTWYGGDTHEYEIMEDEERGELLQDEEEEAIRLQKKALHRTRPEDYLYDEDDDAESDTHGEEGEDRSLETEPTALGMHLSAPELDLLAREFQKSFAQLSILKERFHLNEIDRIRYQLLSLFVTNVALYFSLRTDPDSVGVDLRTHPVLSRVVQIRSLLMNAKSVPKEKPMKVNTVEELANGELEDKEEQRRAQQDQNARQTENGMVEGAEAHQRHRKEKRKKRNRATKGITSIAADEERVHSLLHPINGEAVVDGEQRMREQKRRKLNKIVGAMERERKNSDAKRMASADLDLVREEARNVKPCTDYRDQVTDNKDEIESRDLIDDDEIMRKMLAKREKKEARNARKAAASTPHVYTFKDEVHPDGKRKASAQIIKNRGLTRYRPRDKKTPRTKNRLAYSKAVVRRKGAVREYAGAHGGSYGGEASGINMSARKSSML